MSNLSRIPKGTAAFLLLLFTAVTAPVTPTAAFTTALAPFCVTPSSHNHRNVLQPQRSHYTNVRLYESSSPPLESDSDADSEQNSEDVTVQHSEEEEEMQALILSLASEPTDESRRERLQQVFAGTPATQFAKLFDETLIVVGDRVRGQAMAKAMALQAEQREEAAEAEATNDANDDSDEHDDTPRIKTPEELQLWALVDMMVQSKTIVKKNSGELGNKGSFA